MVTIAEDVSFEKARRATRYEIQAPVRFRTACGDWREGTTVNIGRVGVLIRTSDPLPLATVMQLRVALATDRAFAGAYVACSGRVVRADPSAVENETLMAVTIDDFQLRPAGCDEDGPGVGTPARQRMDSVRPGDG
jgi:hypothetical protein